MQKDSENFAFMELTDGQTPQFFDAEAVWRAQQAAGEVRDSMMWRTQGFAP